MKPKTNPSTAVELLKNGTVNLRRGGKLIAFLAPEIFTEGWAKNALSDKLGDQRFNGVIPLVTGGRVPIQPVDPRTSGSGAKKNGLPTFPFAGPARGLQPKKKWVGLQTSIQADPAGIHFKFTLTPLETVKAIHIRMVVNLPYKDWRGGAYRLGPLKGTIPVPAPKDNRLAEAKSGSLRLGPSKQLKGLGLGMEAPGLLTVLQDNRQWTPYLHAFVTGGEKADKPWVWRKGQKKTYGLTLTIQEAGKARG